MKHLFGLYRICLGLEYLSGNITEGQYKYRMNKARKLIKEAEDDRQITKS